MSFALTSAPFIIKSSITLVKPRNPAQCKPVNFR